MSPDAPNINFAVLLQLATRFRLAYISDATITEDSMKYVLTIAQAYISTENMNSTPLEFKNPVKI